MVVDQRMPGDDRFELLVCDPEYFQRAWLRARERAKREVAEQVRGAGHSAASSPRLRRAS